MLREKHALGVTPSMADWFEMCSRGEAKNYLVHLGLCYSNIYSHNLEAKLPGFNPPSVAYLAL